MSSRVDWYFRQRVTEAELDLAFDQVEQADWNLASDLGVYGVISGAIAVPHSPVANLSIDLTAPGRAYDRIGRRVFLGAGITVDCSKDQNGTPTEVIAPNGERWLSVFIRFSRQLSDPRTDGNNQTVYFRRDEACEVVVRQGPSAPAGQAQRPDLEPDELLVCDVRRTVGQTQVLGGDIDTSRRQAFVFAPADSVSVVSANWDVLPDDAKTVQGALDGADAKIAGHLGGTKDRHRASDVILYQQGFIAGGDVQAGFQQLVDGLASTASGVSGSTHVGTRAIAGTPYALPASNVDLQLAQLVGDLNAHVAANGAHNASQIAAPAFQYLTSTNAQAQIQELVTKLAAQAAGQSGAGRIGAEPQGQQGAPNLLAAGTIRDQLGQLLAGLNNHLGVFDTNHIADGQANAGLHRVIKQPALGAGTVLLWESLGNGAPLGRFRVYADGASIWFVIGAYWDGAKWQWDVAASGSVASAFRLVRQYIGVYQIELDSTNTGGFTDWPRMWQLPLVSSSEASGWVAIAPGMKETGRVSLEGIAPSSIFSSGGLQLGTSATFRTRFDQAPSSVTLYLITSQNWGVTPVTVNNIDKDGFAISANVSNPPLGVPIRWVGRYVAVR